MQVIKLEIFCFMCAFKTCLEALMKNILHKYSESYVLFSKLLVIL